MKKIISFTLLALITFLQGCTSIVESAAVLAVSVHSHYEEIRSRQFKPTQACLFKDKPDPYEVADSIAYGNPITNQYHKILDPGDPNEAYSSEPPMPHYVAEAFYIIAERLHDVRAARKKEWLSVYFESGETARLKKYMAAKYTTSYLDKCFSVSTAYKQHKRSR